MPHQFPRPNGRLLDPFTTWRTKLAPGLVAAALLAACSANTSPGPPPDATKTAVLAGATFITLGTGGGPVLRAQRAEPANAVIVGQAVYLFDAGAGAARQLAAGLQPRQVRAIFLPHHRVNHNAGLAPLLLTRWLLSYKPLPPLPVVGPPGTVALVGGLVAGYRVAERAPVTDDGAPKPALAAPLAPRDLPADPAAPALVYQDENLKVLAATNTHHHFPAGSEDQRLSRSYSYRPETPRRVIVFAGDTGPSAQVVALAKGADLLVSEVIDVQSTVALLKKYTPPAVIRGPTAHMAQDHLTPAEVGKLAAAAGVKEVVLTHLTPGTDGETDLSGYTRGLDAYFKGPVRVAQDLGRY